MNYIPLNVNEDEVYQQYNSGYFLSSEFRLRGEYTMRDLLLITFTMGNV